MSTSIMNGEECMEDPNKCFDFIRTGLFNTDRTFGIHRNVMDNFYWNKYGVVKDGIQVRVHKHTQGDTATELLLPPGTKVHLNECPNYRGYCGRSDQALVEKITTRNNEEIFVAHSYHDFSFEYHKGKLVKPSEFTGEKCFRYPSFSISSGYRPNQFGTTCSSHPEETRVAPGIHFMFKKEK